MMTVVLIGDVVTSRRFTDEPGLLDGLRTALERVNGAVEARDPLALHVRDEFFGVYEGLGRAASAVLRLRLATDELVLSTADRIDEPVELRLGLGVGTASAAGDHRTGTAWRHAASAREAAQTLAARRAWPGSLRSTCRADDTSLQATVSAYLLLQDQLLACLDARDRRALIGLLDGERQVDIAGALGVTQPAIARRLRDRGALALYRALETLAAIDDEVAD
ncbi:MAG: hypothetical protein JJT89_11605 [Nitriliruptoraceae bacterium]|nr:hypothetical protein [Nitriliruptoraceae bacterium]